jgi:hypothetical protein
MKKAMIESPYKSTTDEGRQENLQYAIFCVEDSLQRGEAPFASHIFYTIFLDDDVAKEREQGLNAGWKWLQCADLVAVYTDRGISEGMRAAISLALRSGIPIEKRTLKSETANG